MTPLVSILVPAHNAASWIEATIRSALAQTWQNREIVVVDDGSTDGTIERLTPFESQGVRVVRQENKGASAARNRALADARGDFVQFLDADDLLGPDKIAVQIAALDAAFGTRVASCAWGRFSTDPGEARFVPERVWCDQPAIEFLVTCALEELMFPPTAWLVPHRLCDAAGPWDETLSMNDDGEYMARVLAASDGIVFCGEGRVYYRSGNPQSYGSRSSLAAAESELRAWRSIVDVMQGLEASRRVERAAATGYQRLQARYYGRYPAVVAEAERREREFGGGEYRFGGGPLFRAVEELFGWRAAMRLRGVKAARDLRKSSSTHRLP